MKLKHLEIFHAVMLTGTLSGAARHLHMTQPAATQALQLAELQLGYKLFTRQKNRLVPTEQALALHPEVQRLAAQLDAVRRLAGALRDDALAPLRVLIVPSLAVVHLPRALARFRKRHAALPLSIRTLHTREIVAALALREADVGIVYGDSRPPGLEAETVAVGRLVYLSPAGGRRAADTSPITLEQALAMPLIRTDPGDPLGEMLAAHLGQRELPPRGEIVVQTHHTALVLAEAGFGATLVDSFTAAARREGTLHLRPVEPEIRIPLQALLSPGVRNPRPVADFVAAMREAVEP